ncbi:unnamed protein product, partial [Meganyctiphanes norvegica]
LIITLQATKSTSYSSNNISGLHIRSKLSTMLTLNVFMLIGVAGMSFASEEVYQGDEGTDERQFTVLTSTTGLQVVALNASTVLFGTILAGGLFFLGGLALGALQDSDIFASGRRDEGDQNNGYEQNTIDTSSSYTDYARRSLKALSPVLEMLQKAYSKYG